MKKQLEVIWSEFKSKPRTVQEMKDVLDKLPADSKITLRTLGGEGALIAEYEKKEEPKCESSESPAKSE